MIYGKVNQKRMEKVKKLNLKWYALIHHYDQEKLDPYNVLYDDIVYRIDEIIDKTGDYEQIKEKIDIWTQLYANLDLITEYLIFKLAPRRYNKIMATRKCFMPNEYL